jgi:hypothetical protein
MGHLKAGDRVECKVKDGAVVSVYSDYDESYTFEVVASDIEGYYLYVPDYCHLQGGSILDASRARRLNIDPRYIGDTIFYISEAQIYRVAYQLDGQKCAHCHDFFIMAEHNQEDGTFLCYSCRDNPYR